MTRYFILLTSTIYFLGATIALGAVDKSTSSPLQSIYDCSAIEDNAKRLTCYDDVAGQLREAETAGEIVAVTSKDIKSLEKEAFGFNLPSLPKLRLPFFNKGNSQKGEGVLENNDEKTGNILAQSKDGDIANIEFEIDRIVKRDHEVYWFYLTNGQVWKSIDGKHVFYSKHQKPIVAQIRKAAMSSFLLRINGKGRAIRVVRHR